MTISFSKRLAALAMVAVMTFLAVPAFADHDDWHDHDRDRHHYHHRSPPPRIIYQPGYIYAPPPVVYRPPPPPPPVAPAFNIVIPLQFR